MKKVLFLLAIASMALASPSAQARTLATKRVTFEAPVPCAIACSYWLPDPADPASFATNTVGCSVDGTDSACAALNTPACSNPFPPESFDEIRVKAPKGTTHLKVEGYPAGDWDIAVCTPTGKMVLWIANSATDSCDVAGVMGCIESGITKAKAGKSYIIRAYNWLDTAPMPAQYWWYGN